MAFPVFLGHAGEGLPVFGRVQVEGVDVQRLAPADQEIDFRHVEAVVFVEPTDAICSQPRIENKDLTSL